MAAVTWPKWPGSILTSKWVERSSEADGAKTRVALVWSVPSAPLAMLRVKVRRARLGEDTQPQTEEDCSGGWHPRVVHLISRRTPVITHGRPAGQRQDHVPMVHARDQGRPLNRQEVDPLFDTLSGEHMAGFGVRRT